jgi:uncharacterized cupredoxin-like copper-binding protein
MSFRPWIRSSLCLAGALGACRSDRPASGAEASATSAPAAAAAPAPAAPITVTASDYKLDLPAVIPAGVVTLQLVNRGTEMHHAQVVRFDQGKTFADLKQAMQHPGPPPAWLHFIGGPNGAEPGGEATGSMALAPGQYAVLCLIPGLDGVPHFAKGMMQPFEVAGGAAVATLPATADTVVLSDYTFAPNRPLTAGRHTILVKNAGPQAHELVMLRLAPGKTVQDFATWATTGGMKGPPPAGLAGGVAVLDPGGSGTYTTDLTPGEYGFICFVPDAKDGKEHLMHGMMTQITVAPA